MLNRIELKDVLDAAVQSGRETLVVYPSKDFEIEQKNDNSPFTLADRISHEKIVQGLITLSLRFRYSGSERRG